MTVEPAPLLDVCSTDELAAAGRRVVTGPIGDIVVLWNDGEPSALVNTCIHKQRKISDGFQFKGRIVCPGHQWSFDVHTGYCKERDKFQPRYDVKVVGGRVVVATDSLDAPSGMGPFGLVADASEPGDRRPRPLADRQSGLTPSDG
jgi:nitrite reductase/ring-hydroxylating ferredoxin subunit